MKRLYSTLFLFIAPAAFAQGDPKILNLLPADTRMLFGMRIRAVVESALAQNLSSDIQSAAGDWKKIISLGGFDPLHDVEEVLLTSSGAVEHPTVLVIARGTFDVARLASNAKLYHDVPLVTGGKSPNDSFAFLDGTTVLAGDLAEVKGAIDRRASTAGLSAALSSRIAKFRDHYDIWGVAELPPGLAKSVPNPAQAQLLDSIDRVQFGMSVAHGLEITAEVHARSVKDADQFAAYVKLFEAMTKASPQVAANGSNVKIQNEGGTVRISIAVPENEVIRAIQNQRRAMQGINPKSRSIAVPGPVRIQSSEGIGVSAPGAPAGGTSVFTLPHP